MKTVAKPKGALSGVLNDRELLEQTRISRPDLYQSLVHPDELFWVAHNISNRRLRLHMSQGKLAKAAEVSLRTIQALETAVESCNPSFKTLKAIAQALGLEFLDLFKQKDIRKVIV